MLRIIEFSLPRSGYIHCNLLIVIYYLVMPHIWRIEYKLLNTQPRQSVYLRTDLRVGVLFSGGQAAALNKRDQV